MKEDLGALTSSLTNVLASVEAVKKVAAKFEDYTELGRLAKDIADNLKADADRLSELIALRVAQGGTYE